MTDVTMSDAEKAAKQDSEMAEGIARKEEVATKQLELAQQAQQQIQHLEAEIARGKRMLTVSCLNLCNLTMGFLPRPEQEEETSKNKKNPAKRTLTLAELDKVSAIVERLTQSVSHLSPSGGMPMGMLGPRGMMR